MSSPHNIGQRVSYDGALCTVRYIGEVAGTNGSWLGVEWDDPARGKHDGCHKEVRYFTCISKAPTAASFVRPSRPADSPQSFIAALNDKYASEFHQKNGRGSVAEIVISGKRAEEVGFDKIRRKQAQVKELKIVILDDMQMATALAEGEEEGTIEKTCPRIVQLDLSRNLFDRLGPVVDICRELPALQSLSINGNRFQNVLQDATLEGAERAFRGVKELSLEETMLSWEELCHIAAKCPSIAALDAGSNQLRALPSVGYSGIASTLTSLNLEVNEFTSLVDIRSLTNLTKLRNLHLKGNNITGLAPEGSEAPIFPPSVQYLDVSYNNIQTWLFVDQLSKHFPGLTGLRIGHNPFYDGMDTDAKVSASEESHMLTIARIASLKSLNFSAVTEADRTNAETFYLSRIAKQLATVAEGAEASVLDLHPRWAELCEIYGEPSVIRRQEVNPAFLESRLISVEFQLEGNQTKIVKIPKSFDIYAVKGLVGTMFGLSPLKLGLVWETGEWDPVAGFDDQEGDSSDEEEAEEERERQGIDLAAVEDIAGKPGRWVKREVELKDGPRQLGYCVDGLDVKIRVEAR
ncbi:Fc.00g066620.m01.CDS01 [Cosmosporella sp. VM-42]